MIDHPESTYGNDKFTVEGFQPKTVSINLRTLITESVNP